jgi:tripartite-type tricarboxylate transporter receptor subunit TctC
MLMPRLVIGIVVLGAMVLAVDTVSGENPSPGLRTGYPNKPVRIVASEPGGGTDFIARILAQEISGSLGQNVIVDNRASTILGQLVAKASPDGYTLLLSGSNLWIGPFLQNVPYDPVKDFLPVTLVTSQPAVLVVHPSVSANSVKDLIGLARAKPGELNYGSASTGTITHLAAELFKAMAGVKIVRIPYKGVGPALTDLIAGQVQLMFPVGAGTLPHIKAGRLRALAVTSAQPSALFPGLPTVATTLPGYDSQATQGMFAPAKTPAPIINRLNQEIVRILHRADVKERFFNAGIESIGSSPQEFAAAIKSEMNRLGKVIKDAGIREN